MMHALAHLVRVISGLWTFYLAVYFLFYLTMPASAAASIQKRGAACFLGRLRAQTGCVIMAPALVKGTLPQQALYRIYLPSPMLAAHMQFSIASISTRLFMHAPISVQTACSFRRWMCVFRHLKVPFHLAHFLCLRMLQIGHCARMAQAPAGFSQALFESLYASRSTCTTICASSAVFRHCRSRKLCTRSGFRGFCPIRVAGPFAAGHC